MNTQIIIDKTSELVRLLNVVGVEAKEIESKREALIASEYVNTAREKRLNDKEIDITKKTTDIEAQKAYIDEQNRNNQIILNKIETEKKALQDLAAKKLELEKEQLQLEADKKGFESMKAEKEKFMHDRAEFEAERQLFAKEKLAMSESQKLIAARIENIKQKEENLNRREQLSQV